MATGRLGVLLEGIGYEAIPQVADNSTIVYSPTTPNGTLAAGLAVTLSADNTIALCADGDAVLGKLIKVEVDGVATVQVKGFTTLPAGTGATITRMSTFVGALGAAGARGYIRAAASGAAAELVKARGFIATAADAGNNVMVSLG